MNRHIFAVAAARQWNPVGRGGSPDLDLDFVHQVLRGAQPEGCSLDGGLLRLDPLSISKSTLGLHVQETCFGKAEYGAVGNRVAECPP